MHRRLWILVPLLLALLAAGCGTKRGEAGEPGEMLIREITIEDVQVQILESHPVQVHAHVRGVLGDSCTKLHEVRQERSGNRIDIRITSSRPRDAICTQIAVLWEQTIALDGTFTPGDYTLRVNDREVTFHVD